MFTMFVDGQVKRHLDHVATQKRLGHKKRESFWFCPASCVPVHTENVLLERQISAPFLCFITSMLCCVDVTMRNVVY